MEDLKQALTAAMISLAIIGFQVYLDYRGGESKKDLASQRLESHLIEKYGVWRVRGWIPEHG